MSAAIRSQGEQYLRKLAVIRRHLIRGQLHIKLAHSNKKSQKQVAKHER